MQQHNCEVVQLWNSTSMEQQSCGRARVRWSRQGGPGITALVSQLSSNETALLCSSEIVSVLQLISLLQLKLKKCSLQWKLKVSSTEVKVKLAYIEESMPRGSDLFISMKWDLQIFTVWLVHIEPSSSVRGIVLIGCWRCKWKHSCVALLEGESLSQSYWSNFDPKSSLLRVDSSGSRTLQESWQLNLWLFTEI